MLNANRSLHGLINYDNYKKLQSRLYLLVFVAIEFRLIMRHSSTIFLPFESRR